MNTNDCDRVRMHLMAAAEGEAAPVSALDHDHVSSCSACQQWLQDFAAMTTEMQRLPYPRAQMDLWPGVKAQIHQRSERPSLAHLLWPIGLLALGWRALQLFADLPAPGLVSLVPLAVAGLLVWRVGRGLLAIETWAPELRERGI